MNQQIKTETLQRNLPIPMNVSLWWMAIRPRTLSLSLIPVLLGSALAWNSGAAVNWPSLLTAALCAVLIQAGTNLFNDASDYLAGNDGPTRLGPLRVTAAGLATPLQVRRAAITTFVLALLGGLYLVCRHDFYILSMGIASLFAGWTYSCGPRPLSHTPWGEVFIVVFFGLVAVSGSYYLQANAFSPACVVLGSLLGLYAAAVLLVNNVRDLEVDKLAGRRTLAQCLGSTNARRLYSILMLLPFLLVLVLMKQQALLFFGLLPWLALPLCVLLAWRFQSLPPGVAMNQQLHFTALAQLCLGALLFVSLLY